MTSGSEKVSEMENGPISSKGARLPRVTELDRHVQLRERRYLTTQHHRTSEGARWPRGMEIMLRDSLRASLM
ncbi:hypothetical protein HAX54_002495, partial [Datura stramonium]|nr:hypothetical protein [Datura stramonium]